MWGNVNDLTIRTGKWIQVIGRTQKENARTINTAESRVSPWSPFGRKEISR